MKERDCRFDAAKGIGIIMVIAGHLFTYGSVPFNFIFSFHMPLFLIISGVFRKQELTSVTAERWSAWCKHIVIPFVFFAFLAAIIQLVQIIILKQPLSLHLKEWALMSPYPFGSVWFLWLLLCCNLLSVFLNSIRPKLYVFIIILALVVISVDYVNTYNYLVLRTIPIAMLFFYFGYAIENYRNAIGGGKFRPLVYLLFLSIALYNGTVNIAVPLTGKYTLLYFIESILGYWCVMFMAECLKNSKWLIYIGGNSLYVFSIHTGFIFLYTWLLTLITKEPHVSMGNLSIFEVVCGVTVVLSCSILSVPLLKKIINGLAHLIFKYLNLG